MAKKQLKKGKKLSATRTLRGGDIVVTKPVDVGSAK